jgi:hypothetical protein
MSSVTCFRNGIGSTPRETTSPRISLVHAMTATKNAFGAKLVNSGHSVSAATWVLSDGATCLSSSTTQIDTYLVEDRQRRLV